MKKILLVSSASILSFACSIQPTEKWKASHMYDEFTEAKSCIVEENKYNSSYYSPLFGGVYTYNFFVENRDGKVRAGVQTKPALPISGDIQMKVGKKLITFTTQDTPIDVAPQTITLEGNDQLAKSMQQLTNNITKLGSPYRAFEGKKAKELISDLLKHDGLVKMRSIGINKANSTTGEFVIDESFKSALNACDIKI